MNAHAFRMKTPLAKLPEYWRPVLRAPSSRHQQTWKLHYLPQCCFEEYIEWEMSSLEGRLLEAIENPKKLHSSLKSSTLWGPECSFPSHSVSQSSGGIRWMTTNFSPLVSFFFQLHAGSLVKCNRHRAKHFIDITSLISAQAQRHINYLHLTDENMDSHREAVTESHLRLAGIGI